MYLYLFTCECTHIPSYFGSSIRNTFQIVYPSMPAAMKKAGPKKAPTMQQAVKKTAAPAAAMKAKKAVKCVPAFEGARRLRKAAPAAGAPAMKTKKAMKVVVFVL